MNFSSLVPHFMRKEPVTQPITLRQAMDRFFDTWPDFDQGLLGASNGNSFMPQIDVVDNDEAVVVKAEVAGIDEKDIEVQLTGDRLVIKGEKSEEKEEKEKNFYHRERSYGAFQRDVLLPCEVETDKVTAKFKNGVLEVKLPKTPEAKERKRQITIQAA